MREFIFTISSKLSNESKTLIFIGVIPLVIITTILLGSFGEKYYLIILFSAIPFLLLSIINLRSLFILSVLTIFIALSVERLGLALFLSLILIFSVLITNSNIKFKDSFSSPFITFIIYFTSVIPSFLNNLYPEKSLIVLLNLVCFSLLIFFIPVVRNLKLEKSFIIAYLLGTMVNGIYLIFNAIKYQKREFGFTGIIYVDYVGIAIIICVVVILLANFKKKIIFTVLLGIFSLASILTQTRNSWLTIFITLAFLFFYLFKNSNRLSLNKMKLGAMAGSFLFILVILFLSVKSVNPSISERATQLTENKRKEIIDKEGTVASSLVSRLLVWQTCLNAIKEHPWIGIGVYAFPYSSKHYHTIPDFLYKSYVEGLSPHSGFLGIITETGIVGFLGFLIFYFSALKYVFKSNKLAKNRTDKIITTCLNWSLVYISISLVMTDAWFWGGGIVLWGILLGLNISNRKNLEEQRQDLIPNYFPKKIK